MAHLSSSQGLWFCRWLHKIPQQPLFLCCSLTYLFIILVCGYLTMVPCLIIPKQDPTGLRRLILPARSRRAGCNVRTQLHVLPRMMRSQGCCQRRQVKTRPFPSLLSCFLFLLFIYVNVFCTGVIIKYIFI